MEHWEATILSHLKYRNAIQSYPFKDLFESCKYYLGSELQQKSTKVNWSNSEIQRESQKIKRSTGDPKMLENLQAKVNNLESLLLKTYKGKSESASTVLELKEQKDRLVSSIFKDEREIEALSTRVAECELEIQEKHQALQEQTEKNSVVNADNQHLKETLDNLNRQIKNFQNDNKDLLERMLKLKEEQISQMNELNDYYESIKQKQEAIESIVSSQIETDDLKILKPVSLPTHYEYRIMAHSGRINSLAISEDSKLAITVGMEAKLWNPGEGTAKEVLRGMSKESFDCDISIQKQVAVAACNDHYVYVWNLTTSRVKHKLFHSQPVTSVCLVRDSNTLVSGCQDRTIKIWDFDKGSCYKTVQCFSIPTKVVSSGSQIYSSHRDGSLKVYSVAGELSHEVSVHSSSLLSICISECGKYLACISKEHTTILDLKNNHTHLEITEGGSRGCFSPDSRFLMLGAQTGEIRIWEILNGALESVLEEGHSVAVSVTAWNRKCVMSADNVGGLIIWK